MLSIMLFPNILHSIPSYPYDKLVVDGNLSLSVFYTVFYIYSIDSIEAVDTRYMAILFLYCLYNYYHYV